MLFLALCSASLKSQSSFCAVLCFFENQSSLALLSASLKNQSSSCAALCFFEKPKLFLRCSLLL